MPSHATQLWATLVDLYEAGPPRAALAAVSARRRLRGLRGASGLLASLIRGPYVLPLPVALEDDDAELGAGGAVTVVTSALAEAAAYAVRIETGGAVGADPIVISWGIDFDLEANPADWALEVSGAALPPSGELVTPAGITFAFAGTLATGGWAWARAGVADEVTRGVVRIAAYDLLHNRGLDPGAEDAQRLKERHDEAIAWGEKIQKREAKLDEGRDGTPNAVEPRPRFGRRATADPYLGTDPYADRPLWRRGWGC